MAGRNESCPCGSGKKYKNCCVDKNSSSLPRGLLILIAVIALIAAAGLFPVLFGDNKDEEAVAVSSIPSRSRSTPQPGAAPPGKVWSAEHGHWHDAPTRPITMPSPTAGQVPASPVQVQSAPAPQFTPGPQPPGPVPAGKVWSAEHGHWHDLPK